MREEEQDYNFKVGDRVIINKKYSTRNIKGIGTISDCLKIWGSWGGVPTEYILYTVVFDQYPDEKFYISGKQLLNYNNIIDITEYEGMLETLSVGTRVIDKFTDCKGSIIGCWSIGYSDVGEDNTIFYLIRFDDHPGRMIIMDKDYIEKIPEDRSIELDESIAKVFI